MSNLSLPNFTSKRGKIEKYDEYVTDQRSCLYLPTLWLSFQQFLKSVIQKHNRFQILFVCDFHQYWNFLSRSAHKCSFNFRSDTRETQETPYFYRHCLGDMLNRYPLAFRFSVEHVPDRGRTGKLYISPIVFKKDNRYHVSCLTNDTVFLVKKCKTTLCFICSII